MNRNDLLRQLILPRHDPEFAKAVREDAMRGNLDAQYGIGLIYAEGRGVEENAVEAYAWLSVAMLQGDPDAEELRNAVVNDMSPAQIKEGALRAGELVAALEPGVAPN